MRHLTFLALKEQTFTATNYELNFNGNEIEKESLAVEQWQQSIQLQLIWIILCLIPKINSQRKRKIPTKRINARSDKESEREASYENDGYKKDALHCTVEWHFTRDSAPCVCTSIHSNPHEFAYFAFCFFKSDKIKKNHNARHGNLILSKDENLHCVAPKTGNKIEHRKRNMSTRFLRNMQSVLLFDQ